MAKTSKRQNEVQKHRSAIVEKQKTARAARGQEEIENAADAQEASAEARSIRDEARKGDEADPLEEARRIRDEEEEAEAKQPKPKLLDAKKPGSGAGLKPGDLFAPASNPGAAARVPSQPLQPESMQSHGKGIVFDKDLDNGAYAGQDPYEVDAAPSGSNPRTVNKALEVEKANTMTARAKTLDPDNPAVGARGKDATASPNPIGTRSRSRADVAGGSNSGSQA